jgi:hypothetical protein
MAEQFNVADVINTSSAFVTQRWYRLRGRRSIIRICPDGIPKLMLLARERLTQKQIRKRWVERTWIKRRQT